MSNYVFAGRADIEKALDMLVNLDNAQSNAIVVLEIDAEIERLQGELEHYDANPAYVPSDDVIEVVSGYVERADDWNASSE
ncbi:hypothetical protein [Subtercola boreus]|uniref:Uncharacterized protein n=1 Tax=Subtercola boreus TaxID=120213 RepID=A0A3E0WBW0_9MICO|nr:hypothetical protein [Subtercola boreus]RFA20619.1 hypothetical protein B7R24_09315 [Subtercola boreus]RFA20733.1 hypothetical protein B7R23_09250 [Subtercola boreus]RFA26944.1 hypothetical protein B7R25_09380 [Subtercola boreus]